MQRFASQRAAVTRGPLGTKLHARKHAHGRGRITSTARWKRLAREFGDWRLASALAELKDVEYTRGTPCAWYWLDLRDCVCYSDVEQNGCSRLGPPVLRAC